MEKSEKAIVYSVPELKEVRLPMLLGASSCDDYNLGTGSGAEEIVIECASEMDD